MDLTRKLRLHLRGAESDPAFPKIPDDAHAHQRWAALDLMHECQCQCYSNNSAGNCFSVGGRG